MNVMTREDLRKKLKELNAISENVDVVYNSDLNDFDVIKLSISWWSVGEVSADTAMDFIEKLAKVTILVNVFNDKKYKLV